MPLGDGSDWTDTRCGHGCGGLLYPPPLRSNAEMLPVAEGGKEASNSPHHLPLHPPHTTPHYPFFSPLPFPPSPLSPYPPLPHIPSHLPVFPSQMRALSLWPLICPVTCPHMMPFSRSAASSRSSRMYILRALASFTKPALSGKV